MAGPNLGVAVQKQALVVCDPVKHLPEWKKKKKPEITPEEKRLAQAQEQDQGNQGQCHSSDNLSGIWVQKILDFYKVSSSEPAGSMRKSYVYCVPLTNM